MSFIMAYFSLLTSELQVINHLDRYMKEPGANEELLSLIIVSNQTQKLRQSEVRLQTVTQSGGHRSRVKASGSILSRNVYRIIGEIE